MSFRRREFVVFANVAPAEHLMLYLLLSRDVDTLAALSDRASRDTKISDEVKPLGNRFFANPISSLFVCTIISIRTL